MKKAVVFALILFSATSAWAGYGPPLMLPDVTTAADPEMIEVDGVFYLYVTSSAVDFRCWSSTDLVNWRDEGVVFPQPPAGAWNDFDVWAPEVHRDGDDFYLYYAANNMIGVAHADNPLGPFVDVYDHPFVGGGYGGVEGHAIDPTVFQDDDGQRYLYFAGYRPFSSICVVPMIDMVTIDDEPATVIRPGFWNWEQFLTEAPWMVKHDATYYLMYSGYGADRPNYAVGYATADNPLGPFFEAAENPILHRDDAAGIYGPGHNCTIVGPDGRLKIVYHTKQQFTIGWDREIRVNDLCFADSGKMYVGLDGCTASSDDDAVDDDQAADDDLTDDDASSGGAGSSDEPGKKEAGCGC